MIKVDEDSAEEFVLHYLLRAQMLLDDDFSHLVGADEVDELNQAYETIINFMKPRGTGV